MSEHPEGLRAADATLSAAFAELRNAMSDVPVTLPGLCGNCFEEADNALICGLPERIPQSLLRRLWMKHPESAYDRPLLYKRLTPAMMRLLSDMSWSEAPFFASRLSAAGFSEWTEVQREAVVGVARAGFVRVLRVPDAEGLLDVIGFWVNVGADLGDLLGLWDAEPPGPADDHVGALMRWWSEDLWSVTST